MTQLRIVIVLICMLAPANRGMTQTKPATSSVSGYVKCGKTGEALIGATVYINEVQKGTITNMYGFYSLTLPAGEYTFSFSFIGYDKRELRIRLPHSKPINIELPMSAVEMDEVVVTAQSSNHAITSAEMGVEKLEMKTIKNIPVLLGERDVLKTIQLLPGVKSAGEGSSGFYVRGGGSDQNLIMLDEAPVYNASHLMGFFSVFNSEAIRDVKLYKGDFPAQYGGRLSSVLDVKMNEGNSKEYGVSGGIGLISSNLNVEGPIVKDQGSFIISGRRTYADLFLKASSNEALRNSQLYFYDVNAKVNYRIGENDRVYLSLYGGRDVFGYDNKMGLNWGNVTTTARWNHVFNSRLFLNSSFIYSNFDYEATTEINNSTINISSGIRDFNLKEDFSYYLNTNNTLRFGLSVVRHQFKPGAMTSDNTTTLNDLVMQRKYAYESGLYLSNEQKIGKNIVLNYGLRYSMFNLMGPLNVYTYDDEGNRISTTEYRDNELIKTYHGLEPRFSGTYIVNPDLSVKAAYTRSNQYLHLLSSSTSGNPTDLWLPSSTIIKPQQSDQYSVGLFKNFLNNRLETSVELYYKKMNNVIDYKDRANIMLNPDVESQLVFGTGEAYGAEFMIKKQMGRFNGWISYTLSKTELQFDQINNGNPYPAKYDRTHDLSIVASYQLTPKWTLSGAWVYYTGDAVTYPAGKYSYEGQNVNLYSTRNGSRMPDYHRLDVGATWLVTKTDKFESSWNFSIYNVYARKNAYSVSFRESESNPGQLEAVKLSLFSFVPSFTYNFKF